MPTEVDASSMEVIQNKSPAATAYWTELIQWALEKKASDILFANGRVFARVDTKCILYPGSQPASTEEFVEFIRHPLPTVGHANDLDGPKGSSDFAFSAENNRFRLNIFRTYGGLACACRPLPKKSFSATDIGIDERILQVVAETKKGLILVTGPTGSGKSSTICCLIDHLNANYNYNIITIEDPIEYLFTSKKSIISQREVGLHVDSFATALRAAMRENPDVIFVGEIRDLETATAALQAAETGHIVFSTLHTQRVYSTIARIVDIAPHEKQSEIRSVLSHTIRMIMGQRLLRKVGGGVVAAREVFINVPAAENLIRSAKEKQIQTVMTTNRAMGMLDWETAVSELFRNGLIDDEERRSHTDET